MKCSRFSACCLNSWLLFPLLMLWPVSTLLIGIIHYNSLFLEVYNGVVVDKFAADVAMME